MGSELMRIFEAMAAHPIAALVVAVIVAYALEQVGATIRAFSPWCRSRPPKEDA